MVRKKTRKKTSKISLLTKKAREFDKQDPGIVKCISFSIAGMMALAIIYLGCGAPPFAYLFLFIIPVFTFRAHLSHNVEAEKKAKGKEQKQPDNYEPEASKFFNNYLRKLPTNRRMSVLQSMQEEIEND